MKKIIIPLFVVLVMAMIGGCGKEDNFNNVPSATANVSNYTYTEKDGIIRFVNRSDSTYYLYLNHSLIYSQQGKTTWDLTVSPGTYVVEARQKDLYISDPIDTTTSITVAPNDVEMMIFP